MVRPKANKTAGVKRKHELLSPKFGDKIQKCFQVGLGKVLVGTRV